MHLCRGVPGLDGVAGDQDPLDELVRVALEEIAILERPGFSLAYLSRAADR